MSIQYISGRFLLIQEKTNGAEENTARLAITNQSSIYANLNSSYAVDGRRDTWAHTNTETDPWWRVDLLKVYKVNRVVITNRDSYFYFRINGAVIRVGNFSEDFYSNPICATIVTIPPGANETFYCAGMKGRYVHVHIPGDQHILTLNEVEVYGFLAGNLATDGVATQSSTFQDWFAEKGIDGNRGLLQQFTGCTQTVSESNPWWRLDLRDVYCINSVVITSRFDCCPEEINGAEIHIGNSLENNGNNNPLCAVISGISAGKSFIYSCGGMVGRYVNVFLPGDVKILTLCEVEVYREDPCKQRAAVKMQFSSSSDLTDVTMRDKILQQLGSLLASRLLINVQMQWTQPPKQKIMKVDEKRSCEKKYP
nr:uncharacterized protein LOC129440340 [Misgurnus anguillicaudatus]